MNTDKDMEIMDMFIDLSFLNLCKMYREMQKYIPQEQKVKEKSPPKVIPQQPPRRIRNRRKNRDPNKKRVRRWRCNPNNMSGYFRYSFMSLRQMDEEQFFLNTRMSRPLFKDLLNLVARSLRKSRQRIDAEERLAITLKYLTHGTSIQTIATERKLGKSTIRSIILTTCKVLWRVLSPKYVCEPFTIDYIQLEENFKHTWNIPNCVGVIDTKHIEISATISLKKQKNFHNVLLTAACNANYTFTAVKVRCNEQEPRNGELVLSPFGEANLWDEIPVPPDKPLTDKSSELFPHYFVSNWGHNVKCNLIAPYQNPATDRKKIEFNKRLAPLHKLMENTFGVLSARWMILLTLIEYMPENCESIILACIALHNYIMTNDMEHYFPSNFVDRVGPFDTVVEGEWRNEIKANNRTPLQSMTPRSNNATPTNKQLREKLAEVFFNEQNEKNKF